MRVGSVSLKLLTDEYQMTTFSHAFKLKKFFLIWNIPYLWPKHCNKCYSLPEDTEQMLLNHPIDYLHFVCVCASVWRIARGSQAIHVNGTQCQEGRLLIYQALLYQTAHPQTRTHMHAHTIYTQHMCYTKEAQADTSHKGREQRTTEPGRLGGWSVFISGMHLGWSRMTGIIITSLGSDNRYWWQRLSQYFILKGRMDWSSFCLSAFASVKLLPQYTPEKAHI